MQLDDVDLLREVDLRIRTSKAIPKCIHGHYIRILTQTMVAVEHARGEFGAGRSGEAHYLRTWKPFLILPRMLVRSTRHGGEAGERELRRRVAKFDRGEWTDLIREYRETHTQHMLASRLMSRQGSANQ